MSRPKRFASIAAACILALTAGCGDDGEGIHVADDGFDDAVRMNQVQVLGTHNSYHIQPRPALFETLTNFSSEFLAWEFTHLPLDQQFQTQGIRQIELDVYADPQGGLYAIRRSLALIDEDTQGPPELSQPGFKILHVQDLDFETTCLTFVDCLQTIKAWSDAHPAHLPIAVLVELKDDTIPDPLQLHFTIPLRIGPAELDALDAEIRSVLPESQLITPDDIRGSRASLEEAVLTDGWPTLRESRGKVLFLMDNGDSHRHDYLRGHPSLTGRVIFTNAVPGDPDAAFVKENDPIPDHARIADEVRRGYLVRTRADSDTQEARAGDTSMRNAAIASGAQYVSTDYPVENPKFGTHYSVQIPGGFVARCNPVNAPAQCQDSRLEP